MKTIGMLGGMSWESTVEYYRIINHEVRRRLGGQRSAKIVLYSVDFEEIEALQNEDRWDVAAEILVDAAHRIESGGAEFLVMCSNTMHKVAPTIESAIGIPLVHIADATAGQVRAAGIRRVGLLGTRFTMQEEFYRGRLAERHGLDVVTPLADDQALVDRVIFAELCQGEIRDSSRREYVRIIAELGVHGAEAVILGCTEIGLLVRPEDSPLPAFDTTRVHAERAVDLALAA
ncbi:MAG: aspartate/glutamate racemase family protein [Gemmatimonadetes bacterium]|uniref:Aspartate/glutamate racemase family protein n=1 Tax=Candidatus Kutchimonas denitrificans TaxID=3056748 RepID=A0AAE5CAP0_9BACT|nr:aspartate/glutamate racemase family protein [Gemmatimonadota bacterium]NIR73530.1 aspartate/glutamate racemase family protein [Candidatus Kutchimonas denitrificans]NIR99489.1 aspartate/glutamate racemase family protein [Gemmatimonadota bacterium]NIT65109.1 aspartate/glutamate racemase family protein [Gemmatimonadota bacterium]NIV23642.1 amino acid racemase [Gemmatimonadota bacterium]